MDINTYLRYNNIALIDPEQDYHASCIAQYAKKGYLSSNQLDHLRGWGHSPEAIERLVGGSVNRHSTMKTPEVPSVNRGKWTPSEIEELLTLTTTGTPVTLEHLAEKLNRTPHAITATLYKKAECAIKKGKVLYCSPKNKDDLPF